MADELTHWLVLLQHPVQPLVASHTQAFCALQRWPNAHTVPGAQPHTPKLQWGARAEVQAPQAAPAEPQLMSFCEV
ncbi:MAG: hypothetical protein K1X64_12830 [Myxococcaceae bacterium]|nr:hypothetical protein [Myxococcaceae bacterium]